MNMIMNITLVPTLDELQQYLLRDIDFLFSLHKKEECPLECIFCVQENNLFDFPLDIIVDRMLELHLKGHSKMIEYPLDICEYCQSERKLKGDINV